MKLSILTKPHFIFLVISLFTGLICILFIPMGLGFDENAHVRRIWEMSGGTLIPNHLADKINIYPLAFDDKMSISPFFEDPTKQIWSADFSKKIDWWQLVDGKTSSTYFPTLYIPQTLVMSIFGRNFDTPVMLILYLIRLSSLISFVIPTYFSIKIIPHSKWLFTTLALVPMALLQSGTISPEGLSNGFAFLYVAWVLKISDNNPEKFSKRQLLLILLMTALLFTIKLNLVILVLLLFLISRNHFWSKSQLRLVFAMVVMLFIFIVFGWNYLTRTSLSYNGGHTPGIVLDQAKYVLLNPLNYIKILAADLISSFSNYFRGWIAEFPNQFLGMPWIIHAFYSVSILFFILFDPTNIKLKTKKRLTLLVTAIAGYLLTVTLLFLKDTPVGSQSILRVQGRYFISIVPLICLALINSRFTIPLRIFKPIAVILMTIVPLLFCSAIVLKYFVPCGLSYLTSEECYRPYYRNWAPNSVYTDPIIPGVLLKQTILVGCNNFEKLQLWTDHFNQNEPGNTIIRIIDVDSGELITDQKISNNMFPKQDWMTISFPRLVNSKGMIYEIDVSSEDSSKENAAILSLSYRQEYLDGELYINDQPINTDLIFRYGCCVEPYCRPTDIDR